MPITSPQQSSQYELQNFLNSPSDYDDTNSPFVPMPSDHAHVMAHRTGETSASTGRLYSSLHLSGNIFIHSN